MTRAIKLGLDDSFEVFNLQPYPHLHELIGGHFEVTFLNTPIVHPNQVIVGIALDEMGWLKGLEPNGLASSLRGMFKLQKEPIVGTAVVIAGDSRYEAVDVPDWTINLVKALRDSIVKEAFKYHNQQMRAMFN